ncbi:MAG TPA: hypothetical protein VHC23_08800 [Jatrophihabitans sp.]|nr:hypothetical protein [Jatrophihabitans sp.]
MSESAAQAQFAGDGAAPGPAASPGGPANEEARSESAQSEGPQSPEATTERATAPAVPVAPAADTPVARAVRELDTLDDRELAEHPDVYQRIHAELQSALATIDNA